MILMLFGLKRGTVSPAFLALVILVLLAGGFFTVFNRMNARDNMMKANIDSWAAVAKSFDAAKIHHDSAKWCLKIHSVEYGSPNDPSLTLVGGGVSAEIAGIDLDGDGHVMRH